MPLSETTIKKFLSCKTLQDFADCAPLLIGNPMIIMDMNMRVAACTEMDIPDETYMYMKEHRVPPSNKTSDLEWRRRMRRIMAEPEVTHAQVGNKTMLQKVLRINGCVIGQIHATSYFRPFTDEDYRTVELISDRIALCLYLDQSITETKNSETEYLIQHLLDGKPLVSEMLNIKLKMVNWQLQKYLYVLAAGNISTGTEHASMLFSAICSANDRMISYNGNLLLILTRDLPLSSDDLSHMMDIFKSNNMNCGLSEPFQNLACLRPAYEEAQSALEIGLRISPGKTLCIYDRYKTYVPIHNCARDEDILKYVDKVLLDTADELRSQNSDVLPTILAYVRHGKSLSEVAQRMNIHPNTVSYRVTRFQQLTGIDLSHGPQFLRVAYMLMIMEYADRRRFFGSETK